MGFVFSFVTSLMFLQYVGGPIHHPAHVDDKVNVSTYIGTRTKNLLVKKSCQVRYLYLKVNFQLELPREQMPLFL